MDEREFWDLVNQSVTKDEIQHKWLIKHKLYLTNQHKWLINQLAEKKIVKIIAFHDICTKFHSKLLTNGEGIQMVLQKRVDFCSSDGYWDFCAWLVSRGEEVVKSVLETSNYLIQLLPEKTEYPPFYEDFMYISQHAYEKKRQNVLDDIDTSEDENKFVLLMTNDFYQAINKVKQS
ncbi:DUF4240 domain-containing protein [Bacillus cereus group sp. TH152-1LC]|uniref:DUF4240 domain-containing protein n=1 Tax=Bacillus cereus group sp. TH152-1LC TaxID=3018060 RepID=UPI0022E3C673|nr:DUF4240 domain-containing protein [Bacillus cereus group sp. TH152-1LC]MDA1675288.1 DUF4240 domain-containing protein [Bacillus cereus group sp. TH152-1LC]